MQCREYANVHTEIQDWELKVMSFHVSSPTFGFLPKGWPLSLHMALRNEGFLSWWHLLLTPSGKRKERGWMVQ